MRSIELRGHRRAQRMLSTVALFVAAGVVAAACGGGDDDGAGGSSAAEGFPVTIEHRFGSVTLTEAPLRVVSVGYHEQDPILALGVKPVAVREWFGEQPYATWPWAQDELGDAQPEVLTGEGINFERVAGLRPDLIVALSALLDREQYDTLAKIAPTLVEPASAASSRPRARPITVVTRPTGLVVAVVGGRGPPWGRSGRAGRAPPR